MTAMVLSISALLLGTAFLLGGNGFLGTLVGVRLAQSGTPDMVIGMVMAGYHLGFIAGSLRIGRLIVAIGHIRVYAALAAILSAATLIHALKVDPWLWIFLRVVAGYCMAGLFMCVESWLNDRAENRYRGRVLSLYMVTVYVAQGLGQFLLMVKDDSGFAQFVLASVLLSLAAVPIALTRAPTPSLPAIPAFAAAALYRLSPLAAIGALASGFALGAFYGMGPVYVQRFGLSAGQIAQFMSAAIAGGLLLQLPLGRLSDHFDRRLIITATAFLLAAGSLAVALFADRVPFAALLGLSAIFGGAAFSLYPLSVAHANDRGDPEQRIALTGALLLAYGTGAFVGPFGAASMMSLAGVKGLYLFTASAGLGVGLFALWRMRSRPATPSDEQSPFHILPRTTAVSASLLEDDDGDGPYS